MITLVSQHDDLMLPAGTWYKYLGSNPSVSLGNFTTEDPIHLLGRYNNLTDILYLRSGDEFVGILPDPYHCNIKTISGFLNRSQTLYLDFVTTYRVWYYAPGEDTIPDIVVVDRNLDFQNPTTTTYTPTVMVVGSVSVGNFGYIDITVEPEHYYQISDDNPLDAKTIEFRVKKTETPIKFKYLNNWGVEDIFTQSKSFLTNREVSYDSMVTSRLGSVNQVSFNPKDDSKTTFTTYVLNRVNQEVFADFLSSNLIKFGSDVVTVDKSSVAQSYKDDFYTFSINGVLNI